MKIKSLLYVLLLAVLGTAMTACGDDDEPKVTGDVAGSYTGPLEATVTGIKCDFDGTYTVAVTAGKDDPSSVSVSLPQCSFTVPGTEMQQTIPSVKIDNVSISQKNGAYSLSSGSVTVDLNGVKYAVTLEGSVKGSDLTLNYSMQPGKMPMVINFTFKGKK